jgi:hypothetical protein
VVIASDRLLVSFDTASPIVRRSIEPIASMFLEFIVMSTIRTLLASSLFASVALSAAAQTQPAASASTPMGGAMMSNDCAKPMAKDDHGAEKGTPRSMSQSGPCASGAAATPADGAASTAQAKKLPKHNHGAEKNN